MSFETRPLMPHFGAEVLNVDLCEPMDDDRFAELMQLYFDKSALLFRDQDLSPADQARLAHRFGKPKIETRKQYNLKAHPEVSTIGNTVDEDGNPTAFFVKGGFGWHTDGSAACHVDAATFLYAVQVPRDGGDTLLLSTAKAYDDIDDELRQRLDGVSMLCSFHAHNDPLYEKDPDSFIPLTPKEREALPEVWHDVVQTHPVTGRKVLYLNFNAIEFDSVSLEDGNAMMNAALEVAARDGMVYRHRYRPGDLFIWDNHATLHSGTPTHMYEDDIRLMHRSFVYTEPTERPLPNYEEVSRIFMPV